MAFVVFEAAVTMRCSPERAFDFFADHRNVARVLEGVSKWEPIGRKTRGVGARYHVEMVALGVPLDNVLRLNAWARPREIGWISESGLLHQEGGFTFTALDQGERVRVNLRIAYKPPGSFIGAAIAKRLDGLARRRLQRALERIRDTVGA